MTAPSCKYCGSADLVESPEPPGSPHHARLACRACGRFQKWLPRPNETARPRIERGPTGPVATLRGNPKQVDFAEGIRIALLNQAWSRHDDEAAAIVGAVEDATWFIANRGRPLEELRWPSPSQVAPEFRPRGGTPA